MKTIREIQQGLVRLADRPAIGEAAAPTASTLEQFLCGLRTAWQEGKVRPTSKPKEKVRCGRRRPDPFCDGDSVGPGEWFEAEPWRTSRELFERLQQAEPGLFPDGQLRTLQRRVKAWRSEPPRKLRWADAGDAGAVMENSLRAVGIEAYDDGSATAT